VLEIPAGLGREILVEEIIETPTLGELADHFAKEDGGAACLP
jgi:hypothetical protein